MLIVSVMTKSEMIQTPSILPNNTNFTYDLSNSHVRHYPKVSLACRRSDKTELCAAKQILAALEP